MTAKELAKQILALPEEWQQKIVAVHDHSGLAILASRAAVVEVWLVSPSYLRLPKTEVLLVE